MSGGREVSADSHGRDGIGTSSRADHQPAPRVPVDKVLFRLRELGRILYQLELRLLQSIHGAGTAALGWCLPAAQFRSWFSLVSMVSINPGIWFDGVEKGDAGETIEREESQ